MITTEACVEYMAAGKPRKDSKISWERLSIVLRSAPASGWEMTGIPCSSLSAPGPASRCRECSTRCSTWASTTPRWRGWPNGPPTRGSPGMPTGASSRCSETSCAGCRPKSSRRRFARPAKIAGSRRTPGSTPAISGPSSSGSKGSSSPAPVRSSPSSPSCSWTRRSGRCSTPGTASGRSPIGGSTTSPSTGARR